MPPPKQAYPRSVSLWLWPGLIFLAALIAYWIPLTSEHASIQWDAADLHYPFQKYFSERIRRGQLPFWSPYLYAGYPFLAYPETGAWYLPHWPFFLSGITPWSIQAENALNAFLACLGAYFVIGRSVMNRTAALFGGLAYGLSGFFTGHASHPGIAAGASGFPWLILAFQYGWNTNAIRYTALGGIVGAQLIFAGYIQTAMYAFLGLGLWVIADVVLTPRQWPRAVGIVAGILALTLAIASIQILPTMELLKYSTRSTANYSTTTEGVFTMKALITLLIPNFFGAVHGAYNGPPGLTLNYFYAGLLTVPFAVVGVWKTNARVRGLCLILPAAWYMMGPTGGLYSLAVHLPGLSMVREPVQGWFVLALAIALLAASGLDWLQAKWRLGTLAPIAAIILFGDLFYWNSLTNQLAYARFNFDQVYGQREDLLRTTLLPALVPMTRFDGHLGLDNLYPLDHPLDLKLETTYGYLAMPLTHFFAYKRAMQTNSRLRDGLNVSKFLVANPLGYDTNPNVLDRVFFPKSVVDVANEAESERALERIDPPLTAEALGPHDAIRQDPNAKATIENYSEQSYGIHYHAVSPSLMRLSVPWYPGWRAQINGKDAPIVRVDHALMGVVVPGGDGNVTFRFRSTYFTIGMLISLTGVLVACVLSVWPRLIPASKRW